MSYPGVVVTVVVGLFVMAVVPAAASAAGPAFPNAPTVTNNGTAR